MTSAPRRKSRSNYLAVSFPKSSAEWSRQGSFCALAGGDASHRQDRACRGRRAQGPHRYHVGLRGHHGGRGDLASKWACSVPPLQKRMIRHARDKQAHHHRHADDGVDDSSPVPRAPKCRTRQRRAGRDRAVMLSAGKRKRQVPVETVAIDEPHLRSRGRLCRGDADRDFLDRVFTRVTSRSPWRPCSPLSPKVKAIARAHGVGSTALWMSRINGGVPIYALTSQTTTRLPLRAVSRHLPPDGEVVGPIARSCWRRPETSW